MRWPILRGLVRLQRHLCGGLFKNSRGLLTAFIPVRKAPQLYLTGSYNASSYYLRRFAMSSGSKMLVLHARDFDVYVQPVEQGAAYARAVVLNLPGSTPTLPSRVRIVTARTAVRSEYKQIQDLRKAFTNKSLVQAYRQVAPASSDLASTISSV